MEMGIFLAWFISSLQKLARMKERITVLAEELGIPDNMMTSVYFICMENVNTLWEQLTNPYPQQQSAVSEEIPAGVPQN